MRGAPLAALPWSPLLLESQVMRCDPTSPMMGLVFHLRPADARGI